MSRRYYIEELIVLSNVTQRIPREGGPLDTLADAIEYVKENYMPNGTTYWTIIPFSIHSSDADIAKVGVNRDYENAFAISFEEVSE